MRVLLVGPAEAGSGPVLSDRSLLERVASVDTCDGPDHRAVARGRADVVIVTDPAMVAAVARATPAGTRLVLRDRDATEPPSLPEGLVDDVVTGDDIAPYVVPLDGAPSDGIAIWQGAGRADGPDLLLRAVARAELAGLPERPISLQVRKRNLPRIERVLEDTGLADRTTFTTAPDVNGVGVVMIDSDVPSDRWWIVAAGRPVIATNRPGAALLTPYVVPPLFEAGYADALLELTATPSAAVPAPTADALAGRWRERLEAVVAGRRATVPVRETVEVTPPPVADVAAACEATGAPWFAIPGEAGARPTLVLATSARSSYAGPEGAVQLWPLLGDRWEAASVNRFVETLPRDPDTTFTFDGVTLPTYSLMTRTTFDDRTFPIDVVYTWVDDTDRAWQARKAARDRSTDHVSATGEARFRNRDELRYSLRSLARFAPWVRRIHLLTDDQRPEWLVPDDRLVVVDHREVLPAEVLPTFNSQAIETGLAEVPGLTEHFLYVNDDVFLSAPVTPADFFTVSGQPRVNLSTALVGYEDEDASMWLRAAYNTRAAVEREFGLTTTRTLLHTPQALTRSLMAEIWRRFPEELARTQQSPFRAANNVAPTSSLAQHTGLATGTAVVGDLPYRYVGMGSLRFEGNLRRLLDPPTPKAFCIGDAHFPSLPPERIDTLVADFLEAAFPEPSPWEG